MNPYAMMNNPMFAQMFNQSANAFGNNQAPQASQENL